MNAGAADVIVVGAGHNGLVAAAYLARAGRRVRVLERRDRVGGACVTEEPFPGYRVSSAAYLCSLMQNRVVRELGLAGLGYRVLPKDPAQFTPCPDGRHLIMWNDRRATRAEIARFSRRDADRYPDYVEAMARLAAFAESFWLEPPPDWPPRRRADLAGWARVTGRTIGRRPGDLVALFRLATGSAAGFLDRWFESEPLRAALATDGVIGAFAGPRSPGTGYLLLHHFMGTGAGARGLWGFVRGGMGALSEALAAAARGAGAEIRTGSAVRAIRVLDGAVRGVVTADGDELTAPVVVSNADPKRTLLGLVGRDHLEPRFADRVAGIRTLGAAFKLNLALGALPDYRALPGTVPGPQHRGTAHIAPDVDYIERAYRDAADGRPSERPLLEIVIPTVYEPELAPPGRHIMSIFAQYAPYRLAGASWHEERERFADRVIDTLAAYAPNVPGAIVDRQILSPLDLELEYGLTGGHISHAEMGPGQLFHRRPVAGWARYATPVRGLYLCGAGTHPGGGVTGAPGYNAAREVLVRERGRARA